MDVIVQTLWSVIWQLIQEMDYTDEKTSSSIKVKYSNKDFLFFSLKTCILDRWEKSKE